MKKTLLLIAIFLILTWPIDSIVRPKVNAGDFIFEPDSLAVASLMTYNKSGEEAPVSEVNSDSLYQEYRILKVTAPWCGPCVVWNTNVLPSFKAEGIEVKELDYDSNKSIAEDALIPSIPYFIIQTKVDGFYHHLPRDKKGQLCGVYGYGGSDFSVQNAKNLMIELDKSIHPSKKDGLFYKRIQKEQTKLNGEFWASKKEYTFHLTTNTNHTAVAAWPLDKLSVYELKAIHDDNHAKSLGVLNGL